MLIYKSVSSLDDEPPVRHPSIAPDPHRPAIVVVDDEPDVLLIMHRLIRTVARDHALMTVSTPQAALMNISRCEVEVSLLITDYNMHGMNGIELIQLTKQLSPRTRTLMVTAYDSPDLRRQVRAAGANHYLAKPFALDRFEEIVQQSLGLL